jgi:hypothetical protein
MVPAKTSGGLILERILKKGSFVVRTSGRQPPVTAIK